MNNLLIKLREMPLNIKTLIRTNLIIWGLLSVAIVLPNEFINTFYNHPEFNLNTILVRILFIAMFAMMTFAQIWAYKILCKKLKKREKEIWITNVIMGLSALISFVFSSIIPNIHWAIHVLVLLILTFLVSKYIFKLNVSIKDWKYFGTVLLQYALGFVLFSAIILALIIVLSPIMCIFNY